MTTARGRRRLRIIAAPPLGTQQHFDMDDHEPRASRWLAFSAAFLAVGIPYWSVPYNAVALPNTLLHPGLLVVTAAAALLVASPAVTFGRAVLVSGAAVPAAVAARVLVEALANPKTHNLWPFELVIAALVGFPCAATGAVIGLFLARMAASR